MTTIRDKKLPVRLTLPTKGINPKGYEMCLRKLEKIGIKTKWDATIYIFNKSIDSILIQGRKNDNNI